MPLGDAGDTAHDLTRRAVAALIAIMLNKRKLERMQLARWSEAFDGRNGAPLRHDSEYQAGIHAAVIEMNRASAAVTQATAFFRSCKLHMVTQGIQ